MIYTAGILVNTCLVHEHPFFAFYLTSKVVVVVQAVELSRSIHMVVLHQLVRQPAKLGGKNKESNGQRESFSTAMY